MSESLDFLVNLLDLEPIEVNIFRGIQPDEERQRVFGGQVASQALMAAGRTVEHGTVHSLHSYFLRPGDPTVPILYEVDRIRDGRSFTTRRVVAIQNGRAIFNLSCSFHTELWIKADGELPDDPLLHACVATYASDMSLFDTILAPHAIRWDDPNFMGASLDHCMWFHRTFRADEWLLYDTDSPTAHGARGLARGFLYDQQGRLVVSMVQEGLARII